MDLVAQFCAGFKVAYSNPRMPFYNEAFDRGWLREVAGDDEFRWFGITETGLAMLQHSVAEDPK